MTNLLWKTDWFWHGSPDSSPYLARYHWYRCTGTWYQFNNSISSLVELSEARRHAATAAVSRYHFLTSLSQISTLGKHVVQCNFIRLWQPTRRTGRGTGGDGGIIQGCRGSQCRRTGGQCDGDTTLPFKVKTQNSEFEGGFNLFS